MADERYEIAYQEALRSISDQQRAIEVLQNRASTVASAGAVVTGLIGLGSGAQGGPNISGFIAMGSLLLIIVLCGVILWPREQLWFRFRASDLHARYIEGPRPLNADRMKRDLALHVEPPWAGTPERSIVSAPF